MVNFLSLLARSPKGVQKRQDSAASGTNSFTTVSLTSFLLDPSRSPTSVTFIGYDYPVTIVSNSVTYTTRRSVTTLATYSYNILPLTTTFTPSSACFSDYSAANNDLSYLTSSAPILQLPGNDHAECFPDRNFFVQYYSPGICPSGYSVDNTAVSVIATGRDSVTDTVATCCPTGYQATGTLCYNFINSFPTFKPGAVTTSQIIFKPYAITAHFTSLSYTPVVSTQTNPAGTLTVTSSSAVRTSSGLTVITGSGIVTLRASRILVHWQSSDSSIVSWYNAQNGSGGGPSTPANSSSKSGGLSGGAIAGIVVGALAGLVIAAIVVLLLCKRARKKRNAQPASISTAPATIYDQTPVEFPKELYAYNGIPTNSYYQPSPAELDSHHLSPEMATAAGWNHSSNQGLVAELSGDQTARHTSMTSSTSEQPTAVTADSGGNVATSPQVEQQPTEAIGVEPSRLSTSTVASDARSQTSMNKSNAQMLRDQQNRIRQERARLERLQELSEMDALLEARLKDELDRERGSH